MKEIMKVAKIRLKGFTLVEILVVLVLVGAIAVYAFINVPVQFAKAHDAERKGDVDIMGKFIEEYYLDTGCYPISIPLCKNRFNLNEKTYLSDIPCDPVSSLSYVYVSEISPCPSWYQLYGNLEYKEDKIIDRLGCRNGCGPECQFNYGISSSNVKLNPFCEDNTVADPEPTAVTPTPSPTPEEPPLQYVCAPGGACEVFANPEISGCPNIYLNDPTCQGDPCKDKKYRCHDASGKTN